MLQMANARLALRFLSEVPKSIKNRNEPILSYFHAFIQEGFENCILVIVDLCLWAFATRVLRGLDVTRITRLLWDHLPSEACSFVQEYTAEAGRTRKVVDD